MSAPELSFPSDSEFGPGTKGPAAKKVQEWLNFHGHGMRIDGAYGKITAAGVEDFQEERGLPATGRVDEATWLALVEPLQTAITGPADLSGDDLPAAFRKTAELYLSLKPLEIGGENMGPWVRHFMRGLEGPAQQWCAGSVTTMLLQAAASIGVESPIPYVVNCNRLADHARKAGLLRQGESVSDDTPPGIFLEERTDDTYKHTGMFRFIKKSMAYTIEGNFGSGKKAGMHSYRRDLSKNDIVVLG